MKTPKRRPKLDPELQRLECLLLDAQADEEKSWRRFTRAMNALVKRHKHTLRLKARIRRHREESGTLIQPPTVVLVPGVLASEIPDPASGPDKAR